MMSFGLVARCTTNGHFDNWIQNVWIIFDRKLKVFNGTKHTTCHHRISNKQKKGTKIKKTSSEFQFFSHQMYIDCITYLQQSFCNQMVLRREGGRERELWKCDFIDLREWIFGAFDCTKFGFVIWNLTLRTIKNGLDKYQETSVGASESHWTKHSKDNH